MRACDRGILLNAMGRGKKEKRESDVFSKETFGMVLILFSTLALVCLFTREAVFSTVGQAVNGFLLGVFGWFAFPFFFWAIVMGVYLVAGKALRISAKNRLFSYLIVVLAFFLTHAVTSASLLSEGYGAYLSACYGAGAEGAAGATGGGWLFGLLGRADHVFDHARRLLRPALRSDRALPVRTGQKPVFPRRKGARAAREEGARGSRSPERRAAG